MGSIPGLGTKVPTGCLVQPNQSINKKKGMLFILIKGMFYQLTNRTVSLEEKMSGRMTQETHDRMKVRKWNEQRTGLDIVSCKDWRPNFPLPFRL